MKRSQCIAQIRKFLNARYMEDKLLHQSYSGTPRGGIISSILDNINLDQFDKHGAELKQCFDKSEERAYSPEYLKMSNRRTVLRRKMERIKVLEKRTSVLEQIQALDVIHKPIPCKDPIDSNFRRLQYVRYAEEFIIGIIGSKADEQAVKQKISQYNSETLRLELSDEKTFINDIN